MVKSTKAVIPFCLEKRKVIDQREASCSMRSCTSCPIRVDLVIHIQENGFARVVEISGRKVFLKEFFEEQG